LHHGSIAPLLHCTMAPLLHCTMAPWHHGTMAQWLYCSIAPWHHGTIAPLHHGTMAPLLHCTIAPLHHCTIAPLHHCSPTHHPFPPLYHLFFCFAALNAWPSHTAGATGACRPSSPAPCSQQPLKKSPGSISNECREMSSTTPRSR